MSVADSYRIFPSRFRTLKVAPSLLQNLFDDILRIHRFDSQHHVLLNVESDESALESLVLQKRDALSTKNISAVYYLHVSEGHQQTKILVAECLVEDTVFFLYVNVVFVYNTYVGLVRVSQYGYRFFFSNLPEDVRACVLRASFYPSVPEKHCVVQCFDRIKALFNRLSTNRCCPN